MERAAIYCRVSTEEQVKSGLSLTEQQETLKRYAQSNDYKIVGLYLDEGISARKRFSCRPELMRLLSDVQADKLDIILFIKLDRWFRNVGDYYEVQKILDDHHVTWKATEEDYETVTASGRFKVNIMLSVAQDEADRTSERIKFIFDGKRKRGEPLNQNVPKGYRVEDRKVVLDKEKAPMVRKLFDVFLATGSPSQAIKAVPDLHLDYCSARRIFQCPAYSGHYNGLIFPQIITEDEQQRVLDSLKRTVRKTKENRIYIFSGLLFCEHCGTRLGGTTRISRGREYTYYRCLTNNKMGDCPCSKYVPEPMVEQYLLDNIDGAVNTLIISRPAGQRKTYEKERAAVRQKLGRLSELYVNEMISMDNYAVRYKALNDELAAIPEDEKPLDLDNIKERFFTDWQDMYKDLSRQARQVFWRKALKSVIIGEDATVKKFELT